MKLNSRATEAFFKLLVHWENTRARKPSVAGFRPGRAGSSAESPLPIKRLKVKG
jgi:hypothetical protein